MMNSGVSHYGLPLHGGKQDVTLTSDMIAVTSLRDELRRSDKYKYTVSDFFTIAIMPTTLLQLLSWTHEEPEESCN